MATLDHIYTSFVGETTCGKAVELFKKGQNRRGLLVFGTFTVTNSS